MPTTTSMPSTTEPARRLIRPPDHQLRQHALPAAVAVALACGLLALGALPAAHASQHPAAQIKSDAHHLRADVKREAHEVGHRVARQTHQLQWQLRSKRHELAVSMHRVGTRIQRWWDRVKPG
jgi:hypothetical protein